MEFTKKKRTVILYFRSFLHRSTSAEKVIFA